MARFGEFPPYVPVAERLQRGKREAAKRKKKGETLSPVTLAGKVIATTFWGKAWCDHLEGHSDFASRLPRGRTYVRNGSVLDLQVQQGKATALVQGSELYEVTITIKALPADRWAAIVEACAGKIDSLVELLQGKLSGGVMEVVTHRENGLFPLAKQIAMDCTCPDDAVMCKHVAAALYGVGARLDQSPELLFVLREVDHLALIERAGSAPTATKKKGTRKTIAASDMADVFGIEMEAPAPEKRSKTKAK